MSRSSAEIVLVRHATTADTNAGLFSGPEPTPLDATGRAQADALGARLVDRRFSEILVSPVARARETAERAGLSDRCELVGALVEWGYGDLVGRNSSEVRAEDAGWSLWSAGAPGGETPAEVEARLQPIVDRLRAGEGEVAVVSHGHVLRALVMLWLGLPLGCAGGFVIDPASVSVLGWRHHRPALVALNDRAHLGDSGR